MVSVRKRGKVYEYRFEIATVEGTRKWVTKSGCLLYTSDAADE